MFGTADTGAVLAVIIPAAIAILGGLIALVWRVSALTTKVEYLGGLLQLNTNRLDTIEAKADGAKETAQAAVAAASAVARSAST